MRGDGHVTDKVQCNKHGEQQETFVCQHIAEGLRTKQRVGFVWTTYDPSNADNAPHVPRIVVMRFAYGSVLVARRLRETDATDQVAETC